MAKTTRRQLLTGAAAASLGLPFLSSTPSAACDSGFPLRIVFYFTPNEWINRSYWDFGYGPNEQGPLPAALPSILGDLDPFKDRLTMIGDLYMLSRELSPQFGGGHVGGAHVLTGRKHVQYGNGSDDKEYWATGESVDRFIAGRLGCDVLYSAVTPGGANGLSRISYTGPSAPATPHENPTAAFDDAFGNFSEPPDIVDAKRERRRHVLDTITGNLNRVRADLPSVDRPKLDAHLDAIGRLEADLDQPLELSCPSVPPAPNIPPSYGNGGYGQAPKTHRLHMDVIANALVCGTTQVATLQFGQSASQIITPNWGSDPINPFSSSVDLHNICHDFNVASPSDGNYATIEGRRVQLEQWYARQFKYFLETLDAIPEGDETLLDHTLVVWCKELGHLHNKDTHLYVLAGGACGQLQTDYFYSFQDAPHNNLLVSLCNLMGLNDVTSFGEPEVHSEPLNL